MCFDHEFAIFNFPDRYSFTFILSPDLYFIPCRTDQACGPQEDLEYFTSRHIFDNGMFRSDTGHPGELQNKTSHHG